MLDKVSALGDKVKSGLKSTLPFGKKNDTEKDSAATSGGHSAVEQQQGTAAQPSTATAGQPQPMQDAQLTPPPGSRVRIQGLGKAPQYNGSSGVVLYGDPGKDERVSVRLDGEDGKQLSVRLANIEVLEWAKVRPGHRSGGGASGTEALAMVMSKVLQQPANGGAAKADLYELLGVARDASEKQIKVAYYKKARDLHPDKNSDDPNAEARFKAISEAYQVLSDPERRKMYDHLGAAALEQSENLDNFKFFVRGLFGGEEFEEVLGDVCTLPAFKEMMDAMITGEAGKKQDAGEAERALEQERREAAALAEEEYVRDLADRLVRRVERRARGEVDAASFAAECEAWAGSLAGAPGGMDLLNLAGNTYRRKARKILGGFGGMLQEVKDFKNRVSEGASIVFGAIRCSAAASSMAKKSEEKKRETPLLRAAGTPQNGSGHDEGAGAPEHGAGAEGASDGEDEQIPRPDDLDPADVARLARQSIDLVWRIGLFLMQKRLRKVLDAMVAALRERPDGKKEVLALARAVMEVGEAFKKVWERDTAALKASKSGTGTSSSSMPPSGGASRGAPVHLADEIAAMASKPGGAI